MKRIILFIISLVFLSSCEDECYRTMDKVDYVLNLDFNQNFNTNQGEVIQLGTLKSIAADSKPLRFTVKAVPADGSSNPVQTFLFVENLDKSLMKKLSLNITPGAYDIFVWADCQLAQPFYDSSNISEITLGKPYRGSTEDQCYSRKLQTCIRFIRCKRYQDR